jgi:hypothetical protein
MFPPLFPAPKGAGSINLLKPVLKPRGVYYQYNRKLIPMKKERKKEMKLALNRLSMFAVKAQQYLPIAMVVLVVIGTMVGIDTPESGGGTGR